MEISLVGLAFAVVLLVAVVLADRQLRRYLETKAKARSETQAQQDAAIAELTKQVEQATKELGTIKSAMALKQSFGK